MTHLQWFMPSYREYPEAPKVERVILHPWDVAATAYVTDPDDIVKLGQQRDNNIHLEVKALRIIGSVGALGTSLWATRKDMIDFAA